MRIIQIVPSLNYGDAVGNDVLALNRLLQDLGFDTTIYAISIGSRIPDGVATFFSKIPRLSKEDILIYHMASGCKVIRDFLLQCSCRKVMIYHNITPQHFFLPYSRSAALEVKEGFKDLNLLKNAFESCIAVSEFNKQDLRRMGYTCPIAVLPILVPFEDYDQEPDQKVLSKFGNDDWTNILFVGRIAPNKCQEDLISAFATYKTLYNPNSRLLIVGNYDGMEAYYDRLQTYAEELGVTDVYFTGHISFKSILAYYHLADVFLCMSEHEGFCVPLLEAMKFDVPIVAYSSTAIPYTLGDSGIKFSKKDPDLAAAIIDETVCNKKLQNHILMNQRKRLEYFQYDNIARLAEQVITRLAKHEDIESIKNGETQNITCDSNVEQLLPGIEEKIASHKTGETAKSFKDIPVILRRKSGRSFVRNYYEQINSQSGVKAFIKKRLFGNLLNVLMEQEEYLAEMEERLAELENQLENR